MTKPPLEELYFQWLYGKVAPVQVSNPSRTYWGLFKKLHTKQFYWIIPNDDNRAEDGRALRLRFLDEEKEPPPDDSWMELGCSMLELLIGVSERLAFEGDGEVEKWFWELMENLELEQYNDNSGFPEEVVEEVLDDVIYRTYEEDGRGGLFPLKEPDQDQRGVEMWYQLNAYLMEKE